MMPSSEIEVVPFDAMHVIDLVQEVTQRNANIAVSIEQDTRGVAYSAFKNGICIGAAGCFYLRPGHYKAWVNPTDELKAHRLFFHRTVKRLLAEFLKTHEWECVEATVDPANDAAYAWIQALGFRPTYINESGWVTFLLEKR